ncbi:Biopolymer transport protein ExbD/TolR [Novipirellula aureliae]|uniref:Biopolymer transport protein ExbD/TolR n=1 Tax=Novipirellula aureliae TaxID=2527966 RepID=A0A5C6DLZ4_9BACT|nr:biopolymer transporter ExbD [Novipirellula aureliae]TWU36661.1 Biopolymer transport protein ExbD/TolR [Novipirellula aureliae]
MKLPTSHRQRSLEVKMTPMIDVVFLLLVFFVWTSSFEMPEFDLPSAIAQTPDLGTRSDTDLHPLVEVFDEIVIRLVSSGDMVQIQMNGQPIENSQMLKGRVAEILRIGVQPPVIVDPDPGVPMAEAVRIYDLLRTVGVDRVMFAAKAS